MNLIKRLTEKVLYGLTVILGVVSLIFFLFNVLPGDPAVKIQALFNPCLLKDDLGDPDQVRISCRPPGKVPLVLLVPREKDMPEMHWFIAIL